MATTTVSRVRAAALRRRCLSLAKTCSIGFRSGEYLGRKNSFAPAERIAWRTASPLWLPRLSMDHHVARLERGRQRFLDISSKAFAVDRTIDQPRRLDAVVTKRGDEGHGLPMAVRNFRHQSFPFRRPTAQRLHVGLRPRLVDEHQALGVDAVLALRPLRAPPRHVRPSALAGDDGFF